MSDTSEMVHLVHQVPEAMWSQLEATERKPHGMRMKRFNRVNIRTQNLVLLLQVHQQAHTTHQKTTKQTK